MSLYCIHGRLNRSCSDCGYREEVTGLTHAQVADLKARLRAVRRLLSPYSSYVPGGTLDRVTDLRRKNWRKP